MIGTRQVTAPFCPYCGAPAVFSPTSETIFPCGDLGPTWSCAQCGAWVRCTRDTDTPMGPLADKPLRKLRNKAHGAFDRMCKEKLQVDGATKKQARAAGHAWLARELGIPMAELNIGQADEETCKRIRVVCGKVMTPPKQEQAA